MRGQAELKRFLHSRQGRIYQLLATSASLDRNAIHFNVQTFQSTLRELEKKIELERVQYEEYMLELTLTKKVNKSSKVFFFYFLQDIAMNLIFLQDEHKLSRDDIINSTHQNLYTPASSIFSVGSVFCKRDLAEANSIAFFRSLF